MNVNQFINFPKLIDISAELSIGNYVPLILALYDKKKDPDYINNNGLSYIHIIILQGNIELYNKLIEKFESLKNITTNIGQTNLMIASLQLNLKLLKIIALDDSNNLNYIENDNILPLVINFWKNYNLPGLFYLNHIKNIEKSIINKNEYYDEVSKNLLENNEDILIDDSIFNLKIKDKNNCNFFHWACFLDSLFMVKLFYRFGLDLKEKDNFGDTPLDKAFKNNSIHTLTFIFKELLYPKNFSNYLKNKRKNHFIKNIVDINFNNRLKSDFKSKHFEFLYEKLIDIKKGYYDSLFIFIKNKSLFKIWDFISYKFKVNNPIKHYGKLILITWIFIINIILLFNIFFNSNFKLFIIIFFLSFLLFLFILNLLNNMLHYNYIYKNIKNYKKNKDYKMKEKLKFMTKSMEKSNYYIKDKLYKNYLKSQKLNNYFEDEIIEKFNKNEFNDLNNLNFKNYCPLCLIIKPIKTRHISRIGFCVKNFWLHSKFFDFLITNKNIKKYLLFLILLFSYLIINCYGFYKNLNVNITSKYLILFEVYLNYGYFMNLILIINYIIILLIFQKLILILYCIFNNYTIDEIVNPHKYTYLIRTMKVEDRVVNENIIYKEIYVQHKKKRRFLHNCWNFFMS